MAVEPVEASEMPTARSAEGTAAGSGEFLTGRRGVLKGLYAFLCAAGLGGLSYGLYRFMSPGEEGAAPLLISRSDIPAGGTYSFQYGGSPGILIAEEDGGLRAFSLVFTHLACTVVWNPEKREFHCPCHDALFDARGNVISGPPSAPLERWKVERQNGKVLVGGA
jgi:cytochrome b6-f complex iron-sulfur subunit